MILVAFFAVSTAFGFAKNLMSFPFQAPVFFGLLHHHISAFAAMYYFDTFHSSSNQFLINLEYFSTYFEEANLNLSSPNLFSNFC